MRPQSKPTQRHMPTSTCMLLWAAVMLTCVTSSQNTSARKQQPPELDAAAAATSTSTRTKQLLLPLLQFKRAGLVPATTSPGKVALAARGSAVENGTNSSSGVVQRGMQVKLGSPYNLSKVSTLLRRKNRTAGSPNETIAAAPAPATPAPAAPAASSGTPEHSGNINAEKHVRPPESPQQQQQQPHGLHKNQQLYAKWSAELEKVAAKVGERLQQPPERAPGDVRPENRLQQPPEREPGDVRPEERTTTTSKRELGAVAQEISMQGSQTGVGAATKPMVASSVSLQPTTIFEEKPKIEVAHSWGAAVAAEAEPVWEMVAEASLRQVDDSSTQQPGTKGNTGIPTSEVAAFGPPALWVPVGMLATWLLACGCCLTGFFASSALWRRATCDAVRAYIEELPVSRAAEISRDLPLEGGYDCALSRPNSTQRLLRLEARVQRPRQQALLMAPFTRRPCVVYSCSVSRLLHDSAHPVPSAFATDSIDFQVSLVDAPHIEVEVRGEDVCLFEMQGGGQYEEKRGSERLLDTWRDFMMAHRTAPHSLGTSLRQRSGGVPLEMRECALVVGATVTLVGELHRTGDGALALRPLLTPGGSVSGNSTPSGLVTGPSPRELWRTSWEHNSESEEELAAAATACEAGGIGWEHRIDKVLVCDDPSLLDGFGHALLVAWSRTGSILLAVFGEAWSGRLLRRTRRAD